MRLRFVWPCVLFLLPRSLGFARKENVGNRERTIEVEDLAQQLEDAKRRNQATRQPASHESRVVCLARERRVGEWMASTLGTKGLHVKGSPAT